MTRQEPQPFDAPATADRPPARWAVIVALVAYAIGAAGRAFWTLYLHKPSAPAWIYSDMNFYFRIGAKLADPAHTLSPGDVTHPPAMSLLVASLLRLGPVESPLRWLSPLQLLISIATPPVLAVLAALQFSRRTAWWTLALASLYFPFVDYAGYLLAEVYVILLIPLVLAFFLTAMRVRREPWAIALGVLTGVLWCVGIAFKLVLLPAMLCFGGVYVVLFARGAAPRRKALVVVALMLGLAPGMIWMSIRSTRANNGRWCLVSNKNASDFLLGHYGRIRGIVWHDPAGHEEFRFGSPTAVQRGYTEQPTVNFRLTDADANNRQAWAWIRAHPGQALVLSCEHVYDLFLSGSPWPTYATEYWPVAEAFQFLFVACLLIPAVVLLATQMIQRGLRGFRGVPGVLRGEYFLIISPLLGLMAAAFAATGELRYRIPFDGLFIILAVEAFRRALAARAATAGAHTQG